jgi:hypothetical protein
MRRKILADNAFRPTPGTSLTERVDRPPSTPAGAADHLIQADLFSRPDEPTPDRMR